MVVICNCMDILATIQLVSTMVVRLIVIANVSDGTIIKMEGYHVMVLAQDEVVG